MKRRFLFLMLFSLFILGGCASPKNFVGTWQTDLFDMGNTREDGTSIVTNAVGGGLLGDFASALSKELHWNATMEIREDGTLTIDNGMTFEATWKQEGDKIIISGKNISGTATLSDDQQVLHFKNTIGDGSNPNGLVIGENSLEFDFEKVE